MRHAVERILALSVLLLAGCQASGPEAPTFDPGALYAMFAVIDADEGVDVPALPDDFKDDVKPGSQPDSKPPEVLPPDSKPPDSKPPEERQPEEKPPAPALTSRKAVIFAFGPTWCEACTDAKRETSISDDFDFRWESDESKFPGWVKTAGGYPLFWWQVAGTNNWKSYIGWYGLGAFTKSYRSAPLATGEAAHTPMSEVVRVIGLLPKPKIAFVDFGCGYDARWCVAAAERWGCKCIGIEIDANRASAARERVRNLGLGHLITILEGDAGTVPVSGDVAVAYLYPSVLARLKPRLEGFTAFASYLHRPPGMNCTKNGDTWFCQRQVQPVRAQQSAVWDGMFYNQPLCTSPNCAMCNSIRRQLGLRR